MPTDVALPSGLKFHAAAQPSPTDRLTNEACWQSPLPYDPEKPPPEVIEQQHARLAEWRRNGNLKPAATTTSPHQGQFTEVVYLDGSTPPTSDEWESPSNGLRLRAQRKLYGAAHRNKSLSHGITEDDATDALAFAFDEPQEVSKLLRAGQEYTKEESDGDGDGRQSLDSTQGAIDIVRHVKRRTGRNKIRDG